MEERSKPIGLNGKEEKEKEDRVLTQLKKTQARVFLGFDNGLSQAPQCIPRHFGWERSSYGNYTSRGSTSYGS